MLLISNDETARFLGAVGGDESFGFEAGDVNVRRYVGNGATNGVDRNGLQQGMGGAGNMGGLQKVSPGHSAPSPGMNPYSPTIAPYVIKPILIEPNWPKLPSAPLISDTVTKHRVWIVKKGDKAIQIAEAWHRFAATADAFSPFGEKDHVITCKSVAEAYQEMTKLKLTGLDSRITFLEFVGHGNIGEVTGLFGASNVAGQAAKLYKDREPTAQLLTDIGRLLTSDAEIRFAACGVAQDKVFMQDVRQLMGGKLVCANDDCVATTGRGQWWVTSSDGKSVEVDRRWGSNPQLADFTLYLTKPNKPNAPPRKQ